MSNIKKNAAALLAMGALGYLPNAGFAQATAASGYVAQEFGNAFVASNVIYSPFAGGTITDSTGYLTATVNLTGIASVTSSGVSPIGPCGACSSYGTTTANMTYYFDVSAPAGTVVPIDFTGAYSLSNLVAAEGGFVAQAGYNIYDTTTGTGAQQNYACISYSSPVCYQSSNPTAAAPATGAFSGQLLVAAGDEVAVQLSSNIQASDNGTATASIDPYFYVDPTWAKDHPGYSLTFSAGIDNALTSPVPEPNTPVLLGLGAVLLGFTRWKRRGVHAEDHLRIALV